MKYYISNIKVFDIEKMKFLSSCIKKENEYLLIFSLIGMFKIVNNSNKIQQIFRKDQQINYIKTDNYDILEDLSEMTYIDISQIPIEHYSKKIKEEVYTMRENASLKFIIVKDNGGNNADTDDIIDFYFETNEPIGNKLIIEDLALFLSFKK